MIPEPLPVIEPKESNGVVIEDVSLLSTVEKPRQLHALDSHPNGFRPDHPIRAEHDPFAEAGAH